MAKYSGPEQLNEANGTCIDGNMLLSEGEHFQSKDFFSTSNTLPSVPISHKSVLREQHERENGVNIYISSQVRFCFVSFFGLEI